MGLFGLFKSNNSREQKPNAVPQIRAGQIKCPYCFKEFGNDEVHFKAMTLKEGNVRGSMQDDFGVEGEDEDFELFGSTEKKESEETVDKSVAELFEEKEDAQFKGFWENYANELDWSYKNYPVITREDTRMMQGTYHKDAEGFVDSVTDFYGMESRERICPFCHNPLPPNYGKYQVHFIATVGITSSGKTVYLSQLLKRMDEYMAEVGLGTLDMTAANTKFLKEHPVKMDVPLPQGTPPGALSDPLFYVVLDRKGNKNIYHTLVFYDVAGENCVEADQMLRYGPFIRNADGIIMILDPDQFSEISNDIDEDVMGPKAVLQAMFSSFLSAKNVGGRTNVPLALALSKSDKLENSELFNSNSNLFRHIIYNERRPGFDLQQYKNAWGEIRRFLQNQPEGKGMLAVMNNCFANTGLFAFSALNCDVRTEEREIDGELKQVSFPISHPNNPRRIEEPLLWLLAEFGIVQKLEPTHR